MRRIIPFLFALLIPALAHAQSVVRYNGNIYTINSSAPQPGALYPVLANTDATVQICTYSTTVACPSLVTTYTSGSGATSCPTSAQLTPSNVTSSTNCTALVDAQGNFGVWIAQGNYQYNVTTTYGTFGPYDFSTTGSSGTSGVPTVNGSADPVVLNGAGVNCSIATGTQTCSVPASGVTSLNTLTGALTIACATGLTCTPSGGNTITISLSAVFAITSFTGGWTVPVGASVVNPPFAATYSTTPASANITNTEGISSPTNLTTPFTSGTVTGTFVHTTPETTTFTLSATQGSTVTATQTGNWGYEIFGGYGAAGATSTVNASGTTAVLSNLTVLPRLQIGAETVGESLGPFTGLTGQNIYLLLTGGSHTFTSAGLPAAFNAPLTVSFVNSNGASVTMYLYQSTNALYGNYTIVVAS